MASVIASAMFRCCGDEFVASSFIVGSELDAVLLGQRPTKVGRCVVNVLPPLHARVVSDCHFFLLDLRAIRRAVVGVLSIIVTVVVAAAFVGSDAGANAGLPFGE